MRIIKYTYRIAFLMVIGFLIFSLSSCDIFVEDSKKEAERLRELENKIITDKSEAKLLVQVSQDNLDVLEICNIIEAVKVNDTVSDIIGEIKEEQLEIHKKYNNIASNNVVSIPNYSLIKDYIESLGEKENFETHIKLLEAKINSQIQNLEKLSDTTNKREFKAFVEHTSERLKENLGKTKETLKIINTNS